MLVTIPQFAAKHGLNYHTMHGYFRRGLLKPTQVFMGIRLIDDSTPLPVVKMGYPKGRPRKKRPDDLDKLIE